MEPQALRLIASPLLFLCSNSAHIFLGIKGLITRNGRKPLVQIKSFLILLFHILIGNDTVILFLGFPRGKVILLTLLELFIFSLKKALASVSWLL